MKNHNFLVININSNIIRDDATSVNILIHLLCYAYVNIINHEFKSG